MEKFLVFIPFYRVVVEDTLARTFVAGIEVINRLCRRWYDIVQFIQIIHLEYLITPEDGIERKLLLFRVVSIFIIRGEVIDSRVRHRLVLHKVAVDHTQITLGSSRYHTCKSLAGIRIWDILIAGGGNREKSTACFVVIEQGVSHIANGVGGDTSSGGPRDEVLVHLGHRALRVVLREVASKHVDTTVGIQTAAVTRHIIGKDAVLYYNRDVIYGRFGHVRQNISRFIEVAGPVTIDEDTAAAEIGLLHVRVTKRILRIKLVRISTGDLDTVELNGTAEDRLV